MGRNSCKALLEKVEKKKGIPEDEKKLLMEYIRELQKKKDELIAQLGSVKMGRPSCKTLKKKAEKKKESLLEKISELQKKKDEVIDQLAKPWDQMDPPKWKKDQVQEVEELQTLRSQGEMPEKVDNQVQEVEEQIQVKEDTPVKVDKDKDKKKKKLVEENDQLKKENEKLAGEKEKLAEENEKLVEENDQLKKENAKLAEEKEKVQIEFNKKEEELKWKSTHKYADDITLSADTAHPNLSIDGKMKSFTHKAQPQQVKQNPERFDSTVCVLGSEGFSSEKHYWEVDVQCSTDWDLGVARKSIQRKGKLSLSPKEGFWVLGLSGRDYWARTDPWTRVMVKKKTKKIGVYLSYEDKEVTFFNVTDGSLLFTFKECSFEGEVYPFFKNSHKDTTMKICSIREDE